MIPSPSSRSAVQGGDTVHSCALVFLLLAGFVFAPALHAQSIGEPSTGPVVPDFGPVFEVEGMELAVDTEREYRVVFDVAQSPSDTDGPNRYLGSVARFLNMHARAGVPRERMHVAVVLHGPAGKDALRPGPYRERYDADNPNGELIRQLGEAGVDFYICGQSAMSRGLHDEELMPEIQMALSAMTARAMLQAEGYEVVN